MQKLVVALLFTFASVVFAHTQQWQVDSELQYAGQCNEADRRDYIHAGNSEFNRTWRTCGKNASGSARATTRCLKHHYNELSQECAQCFGDYVGCARDKCWTQCWQNPDSDACANCSIEHCKPGLLSCTGVPEDQIPQY